jgi:Protein of unknown function (DUF3761)
MLRALSYRSLILASVIVLAPFALNAQATASVACKDGSTSSATGRGACSGHGGVDKSAKSSSKAAKADTKVAKADAKADAKVAKADTKSDVKASKAATKESKASAKETGKSANATAARTTAANTDPTNATAKCKDGTYSHAATHRGACSRHGGVADWLKS